MVMFKLIINLKCFDDQNMTRNESG